MYPKAYFLTKFRSFSDDELLQIYASYDYAETAIEAALHLLQERGFSNQDIEARQLDCRKNVYRQRKGTKECDFCSNQARRSPVFDSGQRFCSQRCLRNARLLEKAVEFSNAEVLSHAKNIKNSACPMCSQHKSKVEVRYHYRIWSAGIISDWQEYRQVSCLACGRRANLKSLAYCMALGWWGLPWGPLITPAQVLANLVAMFKTHQHGEPSAELLIAARLDLAKRHEL